MGLQYKIQYKKGSTNGAADALSRCVPTESVMAVSASVPSWTKNLIAGYHDNEEDRHLLTQLSLPNSSISGFTLHNGVIRYKGRVWIGHNKLAQTHILQALHDSGIGWHSGNQGTYHRVKSLFAWPKLKETVYEYVQGCQTCQQAKSERFKLPGLLQPLPVPTQAWSMVTMDFIEGLPQLASSNAILVVIDKFSKYAHFLPLTYPFTALQVAKAYFNNVYKLHGLPDVIISDWDRIFTSQLWQELFRLSDTKLNMSSSYHPQTDGQSERLNQCVETYLRCVTHAKPKKWAQWLPLAQYWYNTTFHSAIGKSPFEILYVYLPKHFGISDTMVASNPDLAEWLKERQEWTQLLQQQLMRAQQQMKVQADRNRSEREFQPGELVYLKVQPYVQTSLASRSCQKLAFRYFGPYKILERVGKVAYKLELPPSAKIHNVIHVSQLKKHVPPSHQVTENISVLDFTDASLLVPAELLAHQLIRKGGHATQMGLVRWYGFPSSLATWISLNVLKQFHPSTASWGQAAA